MMPSLPSLLSVFLLIAGTAGHPYVGYTTQLTGTTFTPTLHITSATSFSVTLSSSPPTAGSWAFYSSSETLLFDPASPLGLGMGMLTDATLLAPPSPVPGPGSTTTFTVPSTTWDATPVLIATLDGSPVAVAAFRPPGTPLSPHIVSVVPTPWAALEYIPGPGWQDSYSDGNGNCFCSSTFDHDAGDLIVTSPLTGVASTALEICTALGPGPGIDADPTFARYNDIQCGNGPPNTAGDEGPCPGRVSLGILGCGHIGPTWNWTAVAIGLASSPSPSPQLLSPIVPTSQPTSPISSLSTFSLSILILIPLLGLVGLAITLVFAARQHHPAAAHTS